MRLAIRHQLDARHQSALPHVTHVRMASQSMGLPEWASTVVTLVLPTVLFAVIAWPILGDVLKETRTALQTHKRSQP